MENQNSLINVKAIKVMICEMIVFSFLSHTAFAQCTADFEADQTSGCAPLTAKFSDKSTQDATEWYWYFDGGSPYEATGQGPHIVTYNNAGKFDVTLKIVCQQGNDTKTVEDCIQVTDCTCEADFTAQPTEGCATLSVTFTDLSTNATSWAWTFPGGSPLPAQQDRGRIRYNTQRLVNMMQN